MLFAFIIVNAKHYEIKNTTGKESLEIPSLLHLFFRGIINCPVRQGSTTLFWVNRGSRLVSL
jgi:hypothetical protein